MAWSHQELECKWVTFQSSASHTPACLTPTHHHENWASPFSCLHQHTYGSKCRQHMDHHDRHQTTAMVFGNDLAIHFLTMPCAAESCKVASILQHPLVFIASLVFMNKTMGRVSWHNNPYIHCCKALFKDIKLSFCSIYLWLQTICFRIVFRPTNGRIYPRKFSETRRYITMSHSLTNPLDTVHSVSSCSLWQWIFLKIWEYKDESHDSCDNTYDILPLQVFFSWPIYPEHDLSHTLEILPDSTDWQKSHRTKMYSAWTYCKFFQIWYIWCKYWANNFSSEKTHSSRSKTFSQNFQQHRNSCCCPFSAM